MATESQLAFEQARQGVLTAADPWLGTMRDRIAVKREDTERQREHITGERVAGEGARATAAGKQRDFLEGESKMGREHVSDEATKQRTFTGGQAGELRQHQKDLAETGREFVREQRRASEVDDDYKYWRSRQDKLADRNWAVEQDEKPMRLKAAQIGMHNATDPEVSIEDVYKYLYENAPYEIELARKRQSDAFKTLYPDAHKLYNEWGDKRTEIGEKLSRVIAANQGATGDILVEAILPKLTTQWNLSPEDVAGIRQNGLNHIAVLLEGRGGEAKRRQLTQIIDDVTPTLNDRAAQKAGDEIRALMREDQIYVDKMLRLEKLDPMIGLPRPGDLARWNANEFARGGVTGQGRRGLTAAEQAGVDVAPSPGATGGGGTPAAAGRFSLPGQSAAGSEVAAPSPAGGVPAGYDFSGDTSENVRWQPSGEMDEAALGPYYNFPELTEDVLTLKTERDELEHRMSRQDELYNRMKSAGGNPQVMANIEEGLRRYQVRLGDIHKLLFKLNPPPFDERDVLRQMGYQNPNRPLSTIELTEQASGGADWIDPRTVGPEERRLLRALPDAKPGQWPDPEGYYPFTRGGGFGLREQPPTPPMPPNFDERRKQYGPNY